MTGDGGVGKVVRPCTQAGASRVAAGWLASCGLTGWLVGFQHRGGLSNEV